MLVAGRVFEVHLTIENFEASTSSSTTSPPDLELVSAPTAQAQRALYIRVQQDKVAHVRRERAEFETAATTSASPLSSPSPSPSSPSSSKWLTSTQLSELEAKAEDERKIVERAQMLRLRNDVDGDDGDDELMCLQCSVDIG